MSEPMTSFDIGKLLLVDPAVSEASWRLSAYDIANGDGIATVTLRSGAQLSGTVNKSLSAQEVLHLNTERGWHTIDWTEIAAISGERRPRSER